MFAFALTLNMGTVQINRPIHTKPLHLRLLLHLRLHLKMGYTPIFAFAFPMSLNVNSIMEML